MRNFIKIVEQADADNMYGDASITHAYGRQNGEEFTDRGRGNVKPRANIDARFSDNPMGDEQLDEFAADPTQIDRLHDILNKQGGLSDEAIMDLNVEHDSVITHDGKRKLAASLGTSVEMIDVLLASLIQNLKDTDERDTGALIDDYYSMMGEGADAPMLGERRFIDADDLKAKDEAKDRDAKKKKAREFKNKQKEPVDEKRFVSADELEDKDKAKDRDAERQTARKFKGKQQEIEEKRFVSADELENKDAAKDRDLKKKKARELKNKQTELDEKRFVSADELEDKDKAKERDKTKKTARAFKGKQQELDEKAPPGKKAEHFITGHKKEFRERYGKNWKKALYATAWKMFGESVVQLVERRFLDADDLADKDEKKDRDLKKKKARELKDKQKTTEGKKRPFDFGTMMEKRFSAERDALGNVTIRDQETGELKFIQGSEATTLLSRLDHSADSDVILAPLMEANVENNDDYMAEIQAPAGTYNFLWDYNDEKGSATAMFRNDTRTFEPKIIDVRTEDGEEISLSDIDSGMHAMLIAKAKDIENV